MAGKKKKIDFIFVPFPVDILSSRVWEKLTNASRVAYLHIRKTWWFDKQKPVSVTYDAMEKFMARKTFSEALKQLETNGFITKTQTGGLFRRKNFFDVSEEWRRIDREETEKKSHTDGISIKGSQKHTVENGKSASTGG
jgi:DNA-binding transcriptional regulator YhcF (GntR family)